VILADVNVLVKAFRPDAPDHARCRAWLDGVVNGPAAYGVSPQVLSSVVRICTHRRNFPRPSLTGVVLAFCRGVLDQPNARIVVPGDRHWGIFEDLCTKAAATGNLVPDAWFAALAIESGCEWITLDGDFARFPGLRWRRP
jgi:toxin-antitoxin system PIN domain toxin